jgi:hypothetical protein
MSDDFALSLYKPGALGSCGRMDLRCWVQDSCTFPRLRLWGGEGNSFERQGQNEAGPEKGRIGEGLQGEKKVEGN